MPLISVGTGSVEAGPWRPAFAIAHQRFGIALLLALIGAAGLFGPDALPGPGLLLVGGALIGVPHGVSDFVVAHRLWHRSWGRGWLPVFVLGYLSIVALVMVGWRVAPVATLAVFLGVSSLHFGAGEGLSAARSRWTVGARAVTPILPIFMFHPDEVGQILAAMVGRTGTEVVGNLGWLKEVAFWPWLAVVAASAAVSLFGSRSEDGEIRDAAEIVTLSVAAWLLPPFLTFALYFCLLHAVRHMLGIASTFHPDRPGRALAFAARIVLPCALPCVIALICLWDRAAGLTGSQALITHGLQLLAALTLPHMALEALDAHHGPAGSTADPRPPATSLTPAAFLPRR